MDFDVDVAINRGGGHCYGGGGVKGGSADFGSVMQKITSEINELIEQLKAAISQIITKFLEQIQGIMDSMKGMNQMGYTYMGNMGAMGGGHDCNTAADKKQALIDSMKKEMGGTADSMPDMMAGSMNQIQGMMVSYAQRPTDMGATDLRKGADAVLDQLGRDLIAKAEWQLKTAA
ncbi:MAG: hypothetical protein AAF647_06795 [Pseudomonadota bacterium]